MAQAFQRKRDRLVGRLDQTERSIVIELMAQTREMVAPEQQAATGDAFTDLISTLGDSYDPSEVAERDPVVRRLLPDGHRDDQEAAAEFRAATERTLREQKTRKLTAAIDLLLGVPDNQDKLSFEVPDAITLMMALADVRLALGERLELRTDEDSEQLHADLEAMTGPDQQRLAIGLYYDFLTWLQESLALALTE
ncbi:DUF2017 family protein [Calidifontibacter indicus]|uniref:Uncharacterized protein DUF2017 n=1 Tax=Calidifontibacter indicus TaxID=419650 RepID=A0A3D9UQ41_9MICO|nr:DUF2017 family protein [Calidifontibacter indicus]REF30583.1 uncharacterized protein DUF2017 [Calidifontibacter indicus]